jgi:hypothetical protein
MFVFLSFLFLPCVFTQNCISPPGVLEVYDPCVSSGFANITQYLSTNGTAQGGVAALLNVASVLAAATAYSGGPIITSQNVTVVDALTADVKITLDSDIYTADITQILANALYNKAADGIYPNLQDPYLAREDELDNIVELLTDIDVNIGLMVPLLATISSSLAQGLFTYVPLTVNNLGVVTSYKSVPLSDIIYTGLFSQSLSSVNSAGDVNNVESNPIVSALITPYLDPQLVGNSYVCDTTLVGTTLAPGWPYASNYHGYDGQAGGTIGQLVTNPVTGLPYEAVSTCEYGNSFGTSTPYPSRTGVGIGSYLTEGVYVRS